jgi:hypothetical protein
VLQIEDKTWVFAFFFFFFVCSLSNIKLHQ